MFPDYTKTFSNLKNKLRLKYSLFSFNYNKIILSSKIITLGLTSSDLTFRELIKFLIQIGNLSIYYDENENSKTIYILDNDRNKSDFILHYQMLSRDRYLFDNLFILFQVYEQQIHFIKDSIYIELIKEKLQEIIKNVSS